MICSCCYLMSNSVLYFRILFVTDRLKKVRKKTQFHQKTKIALRIIDCTIDFSKFYGKVGVIFWFLFHLIWKNYVLYWDFDLKSWIVDFFTRFTREKTPQNNFSSQNFSVENTVIPRFTCLPLQSKNCKKNFY